MKLTIIAKIGETCTRFLQPTCSECLLAYVGTSVELYTHQDIKAHLLLVYVLLQNQIETFN